jgi:methylated-DNA-[protein]-cysteine S-methyltransferase
MRVDQRRVAWRVVNQAWAAIDAYYQGNGTAAQQVPILQPVGPFHERVRRSLRATRYGEHLTYTELAAAAGNSAAARAAAAACAHNNIALFVPCHRVIRTNGTLGGFLYGLPLKQRLLNREGLPTRSGSSRPPATQAAL